MIMWAKVGEGLWIQMPLKRDSIFLPHLLWLDYRQLSYRGQILSTSSKATFLSEETEPDKQAGMPAGLFLRMSGTVWRCLVTLQFPLNCKFRFGSLVWRVSLFDCVNSLGITFSFTETHERWGSTPLFRKAGCHPAAWCFTSPGPELYLPSKEEKHCWGDI